MLTEKAKARRRKLNDVNIKVTFMIWLIEFVGSFIQIFIPKMVGHGQVGTAAGLIFVVSFQKKSSYSSSFSSLYPLSDEPSQTPLIYVCECRCQHLSHLSRPRHFMCLNPRPRSRVSSILRSLVSLYQVAATPKNVKPIRLYDLRKLDRFMSSLNVHLCLV